jgi:hypothetical protein
LWGIEELSLANRQFSSVFAVETDQVGGLSEDFDSVRPPLE